MLWIYYILYFSDISDAKHSCTMLIADMEWVKFLTTECLPMNFYFLFVQFEQFRQRAGEALPAIPKSEIQGKNEFESLKDLTDYLHDEDRRREKELKLQSGRQDGGAEPKWVSVVVGTMWWYKNHSAMHVAIVCIRHLV